MRRSVLAGRAALMLGLVMSASPAMAGSRAQLQDQPFPGPGHHTVMVRATVDPGGQVPPHVHPGLEMGYVLKGEGLLDVAGRPPRPVSAGDSFAIPQGTVHSVRNTGGGELMLLSTYVVEVGKPVLIPVDK